MKHRFGITILTTLVTLLGACASTAADPNGQGRNPSIITQAEIEASTATTVHQLVQSLRPSWLRPRGGASQHADPLEGGDIVVYLNQSRVGTTAELRNMPVGGITSLQFIDARAATQRWGTGHTQGAIVVSTGAGSR